MVDAVFNHCGRKFALAGRPGKGQASAYADWFMVQDWSDLSKHENTRDGRFYSFAFADWMPKLNTNNEEVIRYFCDVCEDGSGNTTSTASVLMWEMKCPTGS